MSFDIIFPPDPMLKLLTIANIAGYVVFIYDFFMQLNSFLSSSVKVLSIFFDIATLSDISFYLFIMFHKQFD